jgi:hypothetical protein
VASGIQTSAYDAELSRRVREGDGTAVQELLDRDHPVAALFARLAVSGGDPQGAVERAWQQFFADVVAGTILGSLRTALLVRVAAAGGAATQARSLPHRPSLGTFTSAGDRWEGWWDKEPPAWPTNTAPRPDQILTVLLRLPPKLRELLVLRDVAELSEAEASLVLGDAVDGQPAIFESAEEAYLIELDREMSGA